MPELLPRQPPNVGELVRVRQRHWIVEDVNASETPGHSARVSLACADDDAQGEELTVFWDCEPDRRIIESEAWDTLGQKDFDPPRQFAAYLNTLRWNAVTATDPKLLQAPFRAGIRLDAYQMEPLRKAVAMPRVALFIADDTGLGKTIEAGLIVRELLLRKKVRSIVISAPASVLEQWRAEMEERFGLRFEILDRAYFARMRHDRGYGVNPWRTHSRFLVSHNLLRDETYAAPLRLWLGDRRPGSLFILDEAHHAAPASGQGYAIDSKFTRAVRDLVGRFEHRLFLSATPHNGHSNSFSALMELLDPQRFTRGVKLRDDSARKNLRETMVRRLKADLRESQGGFPTRIVEPVIVDGLPDDAPELVLSELLDDYRGVREKRFRTRTRKQQATAALLTVGLQQRLLSSIEAFAVSLERHRNTVRKEWKRTGGARPGRESVRAAADAFTRVPDADSEDDAAIPDDGSDDLDEARGKAGRDESKAEEAALAHLNREAEAGDDPSVVEAKLWEREQVLLDRMMRIADKARGLPDAKMRVLLDWIRDHLCPGMPPWGESVRGAAPRWNDRRVLIFTENREGTKRYLRQMLGHAIRHTDRAAERIETIDGLVAGPRRREIQRRFNAPPSEDPLRILLATDAAREGLNFQAHCADLFHFDLPWNPGRIEQRNGRIDRKLQPAPEVRCRYFKLPQRKEDRVLEVLVRKTETIRRELGSLSRVLEEDMERRILKRGIRHRETNRLKRLLGQAEARLDSAKQETAREELPDERRRDQLEKAIDECRGLLQKSREETGFDEAALRDALSCSLELLDAEPLRRLDDAGEDSRWEFPLHVAWNWEGTLDALRAPRKRDQKLAEWRQSAPIRPVIFKDAGRLTEDRVQLHLEQRVARRLLSRFRAQGFVHHDLSRACLVQTADSIPRVVLLGRLCLFGRRAERLHEELTMVAARWSPPRRRKNPLKPYAPRGQAAANTERLLRESLATRGGREPAPQVAARLREAAWQDIPALLPHLERDAKDRGRRAEKLLKERGEREAKELRVVLETQRKRVTAALDKHEKGPSGVQLRLFGDNREAQKQYEDDVRAWRCRIAQFERELESEPERIRRFYEVKATRFEPVGLAYLWPESN